MGRKIAEYFSLELLERLLANECFSKHTVGVDDMGNRAGHVGTYK